MKKIKENKGITLIALIITIIVLLILAVVAISAVQGDGIIAHAKNARDDYQVAQEEENMILENYLLQIEETKKEDINSNTYIGKYFYNNSPEEGIALKFLNSNYIVYYEKNYEDGKWYYNNIKIEDYLTPFEKITNKDDPDFIEYCNKWGIDLNEIGEFIIQFDGKCYKYFDSTYTKFYDGNMWDEPLIDSEECKDNDLIKELEDAVLDENIPNNGGSDS